MGAALRVGHAIEDADSARAPAVQGGPKVCTGRKFSERPFKLLNGERDRRAAAFCVVCERYGAMSRIARSWGVSITMVVRVRDGLAPLTDDRIRALPRAQREHLNKVLEETSQLSFAF